MSYKNSASHDTQDEYSSTIPPLSLLCSVGIIKQVKSFIAIILPHYCYNCNLIYPLASLCKCEVGLTSDPTTITSRYSGYTITCSVYTAGHSGDTLI